MATQPIHIIKAFTDVSDLTSNSLNLLASFSGNYGCEKTVLIHETIHGHIAVFTRMSNLGIPGQEGLPLRLDASDILFLGTLPGFRWIEATSRKISLGFTNE